MASHWQSSVMQRVDLTPRANCARTRGRYDGCVVCAEELGVVAGQCVALRGEQVRTAPLQAS